MLHIKNYITQLRKDEKGYEKILKKRIMVAAISIAVSVVVAIFLLNQEPDFIKILANNNEAVVLTAKENIVKNIIISMFCGATIYSVFYAMPHEYKKANKKNIPN